MGTGRDRKGVLEVEDDDAVVDLVARLGALELPEDDDATTPAPTPERAP